jgi:hypothetical protein
MSYVLSDDKKSCESYSSETCGETFTDCTLCSSDYSTCKRCAKGKILKDNACIDCALDGCSVCNRTGDKCIKCNLGKQLSKTDECIDPDIPNCSKVDKDNLCKKCEEGYAQDINDGLCYS